MLLLAVTALLSGLGFKLSLVPFHAWTPQAYSTADLGTAAALAAASKISAVAALLVVGQAVAGAAVDTGSVSVVIGTLAAASLLLGNVMALRQPTPPGCSPGPPCRRPAGWCCRWPR